MNIPFATNRGALDRLGFLSSRDVRPPSPDLNDDRAPLSPQYHNVDLEAQHPPPAAAEMTERTTQSRFIHRFHLSLFSVDSNPFRSRRPVSSNYSGDGLPPDTVINSGALETPKTPEFRIGVQDLPSTRLHLPSLERTWTVGSNGPPSRPATRGDAAGVQEPAPAVVRSGSGRSSRGTGEERSGGRRHRRHRRDGSGSGGSRRHRGAGSSSQESGSGSREGGDREERRRRRRRRRDREGSQEGATSTSSSSRERGPPPKNFLFCFPWIKSRRIRKQILRCFISGMFLTLILTIYLSLSITKNINTSEFTVLLILVILFITIFFCHSLVRLCMLIMRNKANPDDPDGQRQHLPEMMGPGGYAIPRRPIRVVLARDEEAAGIESEATKTDPPAYGRWRESVRVDPDRIYWMRNEAATEMVQEDGRESPDSGVAGPSRINGLPTGPRAAGAPRPPSYASDDGVSYVVEAQPRSIAPTGEVPLRGHPAEAGRAGLPAAW